jgi:hypothetical protein
MASRRGHSLHRHTLFLATKDHKEYKRNKGIKYSASIVVRSLRERTSAHENHLVVTFSKIDAFISSPFYTFYSTSASFAPLR